MAAIEAPEPSNAPNPALAPRPQMSKWMASLNEPMTPAAKPAEPAAIAPAPVPAPVPAPEPPKPNEPKPAAEPAKSVDDTEPFPRKSEDWNKWKAARKQSEDALKAQIAEREAKINEYTEKMSKLGDIDETLSLKEKLALKEKEASDYEQRLRVVDVEKHPKFQAYFNNKINPRIEMAKKLVGEENAARIEALIKAPDSDFRTNEIRAIVGTLEVYDQGRMAAVINDIDSAYAERSSEIAKANENYQNMTKAEADRAKAGQDKLVKEFESSFKTMVSKATDAKDGLFLFQKRDGDEAWNKSVEGRIESARNLMFSNNASPDRIAQAALYATALPAILESYISREQEITTLKEQVKKLSASSAGALPNGKAPNGNAPAIERRPMAPGTRPMDISKNWMQKMHEAADRMTQGS